MYTRLTKIVKDQDGRDCVACVNFGTERCRIHNDVPDCARCPMLGAIFNQLYALENMVLSQYENNQDEDSDKSQEK